MAHQAFKEKKAKLANKKQNSVLEKYGNAAPEKPDADLLLPASEAYVEYDRTCAPCSSSPLLCIAALVCAPVSAFVCPMVRNLESASMRSCVPSCIHAPAYGRSCLCSRALLCADGRGYIRQSRKSARSSACCCVLWLMGACLAFYRSPLANGGHDAGASPHAHHPPSQPMPLVDTAAACMYTCGALVCRGKVVRGAEAVVRSRYEEDVYPGNHTSVWGSFWADGRWGYACCRSHLKASLCMGSRVQDVAQEMAQLRQEAAGAAGGGTAEAGADDTDAAQLKRKREEGDGGEAAARDGDGGAGVLPVF